MSEVVKGNIAHFFKQGSFKGSMYVDWPEVHPGISSYLDLWQSPSDAEFGPVAREVLRQSSQTKLMVFELAQAPNIDKDLQVQALLTCFTCLQLCCCFDVWAMRL